MPQVTGPISTTDPSDVYPTHDALLGLGGMREVANPTERNTIPTERRRHGMIVFTVNDQTYWMLRAAPWLGSNADWLALDLGKPPPAPTHYVHSQGSAADVWIVQHNLGYDPVVEVVGADGARILGFDLAYANDHKSVTLGFSQAITGRALLGN